MKKDIVSLTFPAKPLYISQIRGVINGFCDRHTIDNETRDCLALAVNEAFSNIIKHAYGEDGEMILEIWLSGKSIIAVAKDKGCGFDHRSMATLPLAPGEPIESGYGILLMKKMVDEVKFEECMGGGLSVTLVKRL